MSRGKNYPEIQFLNAGNSLVLCRHMLSIIFRRVFIFITPLSSRGTLVKNEGDTKRV